MKKFFTVILLLFLCDYAFAQANFSTSLHATRQGKTTAYRKENGGMELVTNIPMSQLSCLKCHSTTNTYPNGNPIDDSTYAPSCNDCHDFTQGSTVEQQTCLNCHNRQVYERQVYPDSTAAGDVHRKAGLTCMSCHKKDEMHGDGTAYTSWFDDGASKTRCVECHPLPGLSSNTSHDVHAKTEKVDCVACHTTSIVSCVNCHFETLIAIGKNRALQKIKGFEMLVKRNGKITSGTFMTHTYNGKTNVIIAPFRSHLIQKNARTCIDCHVNMGGTVAAIAEYNAAGTITMTKWNETTKKMVTPVGVVPLTSDFKTAMKFDFATYDGDVNDITSDPNLWRYFSSNIDNIHAYRAEPLDNSTLTKLGFTRLPTEVKEIGNVPAGFELSQNYPNPFNPTTTIQFSLPSESHVIMNIYDALGRSVKTLVDETKAAGTYAVDFNATDLSSGVYFCKITAANFTATRKLLLMK